MGGRSVGARIDKRRGRILQASEAEAARIRKQAGKPPPDNRPLRAIIWYRISAPLRWPAERRERKGLPPYVSTRSGYVGKWLVSWLCFGTPLALIVNWRGGLGPNNKGPDEQYFAWAPSMEQGRQGAVVVFIGSGILLGILTVCLCRQAVRDGFIDGPSTPSQAQAQAQAQVQGRDRRSVHDELPRHPFPSRRPDDGPGSGLTRG